LLVQQPPSLVQLFIILGIPRQQLVTLLELLDHLIKQLFLLNQELFLVFIIIRTEQ